jgi:hypothetical protein
MNLTPLRQILARRPSPPSAGQPQPGQPQPGQLSRHRLPAGRWRPHTIQLCIHCQHNPAGFWVSRNSSQTVRRPWCLSCCQSLDPGCYHVRPFES